MQDLCECDICPSVYFYYPWRDHELERQRGVEGSKPPLPDQVLDRQSCPIFHDGPALHLHGYPTVTRRQLSHRKWEASVAVI